MKKNKSPSLGNVGAATILLSLAGCSCHSSGGPSYAIFGAYFPSWLLSAVIGVLAAFVAHRLFVATGLARILPYQLSVCTAIGLIIGVLLWLFGMGQP